MLAVSIKNLSHKINNKPILNNVNFELKKDSIACILGPSGSGKTTLLKLIAGLDKVQSGHILINDQEVSSVKKHLPTEKRRIGFLFQDYALFPHLTVKENLKYPINFKNSIYKIYDIIDVYQISKAALISFAYFILGIIIFYRSYDGARNRGTLINMGE